MSPAKRYLWSAMSRFFSHTGNVSVHLDMPGNEKNF